MTVTFRFALPEECMELKLHQDGPAAHSVLSQLARELRVIRKYEEHGEEVLDIVNRIEGVLYGAVTEEGIEI